MDVDDCKKELTEIDLKKAIVDVEKFCVLLKQNKMKQGKETFSYLPFSVQCMFLHYSRIILSSPHKYSKETSSIALSLLRLIRLAKDARIYRKYTKLGMENLYNDTINGVNEPKKGSRKKYAKEYQKKEEPAETDPLYIFYTSLYEEVPNSKLAVQWLTEHGVYENEQRDELIAKYRKIK